jgi:hypothetical protein
MNPLMSGAIAMGYLVAGLFFLRFWRRTDESLFLYFCAAFWILAVQRVALALTAAPSEDDTLFYIIRLVAYVVLLAGIWQKNRASGSEKG